MKKGTVLRNIIATSDLSKFRDIQDLPELSGSFVELSGSFLRSDFCGIEILENKIFITSRRGWIFTDEWCALEQI